MSAMLQGQVMIRIQMQPSKKPQHFLFYIHHEKNVEITLSKTFTVYPESVSNCRINT